MSQNNQLQPPKQNSTAVVHVESSFSGPLPPPNILQAYDDVVPGAAKIIIEMAEKQSSHRQELEKKVIQSDISNSKLGLFFGLIIGLACIIGGVITTIWGHEISGVIISMTGITGLVGTFVYGSRGRKKEREEKNKE